MSVGRQTFLTVIGTPVWLFRFKQIIMPSLTMHVDNLKCGGCSNTVTRRVQELPGVGAVVVDPQAGTINVFHDGTTEHDQVAALLMKLGYPEHGMGGMLEVARSYVSCAIGRLRGED